VTWIFENWERFWEVTLVHLRLSVVPVLIGFVLSVPIGWFASRSATARAVLFPFANILFTIPSIALIVITPVLLGVQILDEINVIVPLVVYTVALMIRSVADALSAVPATSSPRRTRWGSGRCGVSSPSTSRWRCRSRSRACGSRPCRTSAW